MSDQPKCALVCPVHSFDDPACKYYANRLADSPGWRHFDAVLDRAWKKVHEAHFQQNGTPCEHICCKDAVVSDHYFEPRVGSDSVCVCYRGKAQHTSHRRAKRTAKGVSQVHHDPPPQTEAPQLKDPELGQELVYTVDEARALLKIARSEMDELLRQHDGITPIKIGSKIRIPASELQRFVRKKHEQAMRERRR